MKTMVQWLLELLPESITSTSESRRFVAMGIVRLNGVPVDDLNRNYNLKNGDVIEIGKRFTIIYGSNSSSKIV